MISMLRRSYLSTTVTVLGIESLSRQIENTLSDDRNKPYRWDELDREDKKNIREFLKRRQLQGAEKSELRLDLKNLVGLASTKAEGSLTTSNITQFGKVATRPTRVLPQFLIFTGAESPNCFECRCREYEPSDTHPDKMRCKECGSLYTDYELASMISTGF